MAWPQTLSFSFMLGRGCCSDPEHACDEYPDVASPPSALPNCFFWLSWRQVPLPSPVLFFLLLFPRNHFHVLSWSCWLPRPPSSSPSFERIHLRFLMLQANVSDTVRHFPLRSPCFLPLLPRSCSTFPPMLCLCFPFFFV